MSDVTRDEFNALKAEVQRLRALVEGTNHHNDACRCEGYVASPGAAKPHCDEHPQRQYRLMRAGESEWWLPVMTEQERDEIDY